jgi:redox-sensitive bicupin YhaK (pirin superfamily)
MHRDSKGNALEITPGAMNLMTAGRGIAHSERSPLSARRGTEGIFGIQSWIALPQAQEETDPSFQHFDAASLPTVEDAGVRARVIAGSAFGRTSPVGLLSEWLYAEVSLAAGARAPFDPGQEERAIYVVEGEVEIAGETFEGPRLLVFHPGGRISVRATRPARLMFLGGPGIGGPPLYLVEFRVLAQGTDRASQRRLEDGKIHAGAGRNRVHSASRILGKSPGTGGASAQTLPFAV